MNQDLQQEGLLGKEGKKRKMLIDIKPIIEDIIKVGVKKGQKSPKEINVIDIERMTLRTAEY